MLNFAIEYFRKNKQVHIHARSYEAQMESFDPFLIKKNSTLTPYEQAKTVVWKFLFLQRYLQNYVNLGGMMSACYFWKINKNKW